MSEYARMTIAEFTAELSAKSPVPGGGGAAALAGALGTALGCMVANLTIGKEKYHEAEATLTAARARAETITGALLELITGDAAAFAPLAEAYRLPATTEEEKELKVRAMEPALKTAALAPLAIMQKSAEAITVLEIFAEWGNAMAVSDAACGAALARAAMQAAWLNVCVNMRLMTDTSAAEELAAEGRALLAEYGARAGRLYESVEAKLTC